MAETVVIVESPTKAKSIQGFLGSGYIVKASMGHVADLPAKLPRGAASVGVSVTSSNPPEVTFPYGMPVLDGKKGLIESLRKICKGKKVLLATDPDREGEAIAWCLQNLLKGSAKEMKRVTFSAITPEGVRKGMANERGVDRALVAAQLGRRSLDRLFGYGLSILASNAIGVNRLSVGRVQTAVLSMVVDREQEIASFKPEPRYVVILDDGHKNRFRSKTFEKKEDAERLLSLVESLVKSGRLITSEVKRDTKKEAPLPPFKTSTMQQVAAKALGWSPTKTMNIAQKLFEDKHLITYHRSDSIRVDDETREIQKKFAQTVWPDLVPDKPNIYKNTGGSQDAHECVHPNYLDSAHAPDKVKPKLTDDEFKLYDMIWGRFHGAMAKPALWDTIAVRLSEKGSEKPLLGLQGRNLIFEGWRRLDKTAPKTQDKPVAGDLKKGDVVTGKPGMDSSMTKPPSAYTTADLLKDMEKNGVGRPATAAAAVDTLFTRRYAKEGAGKKIESTPTGRAVIAWAGFVCPELRDVKYTSRMEDELDKVSEGKDNWKRVVADFHDSVLVPSVQKGRAEASGNKFRLDEKDMPKEAPSCSKGKYSSGKPGKNWKKPPPSKGGTLKGYSKNSSSGKKPPAGREVSI